MRENLRMFRLKRRLSQAQISAKLGYSRNQYARIENGEQGVSMRFVEALSEVFNLSLEEAKELTKRENE